MTPFTTIPNGRVPLDQIQRARLRELIILEPRPGGISLARWAVLSLGAADALTMIECAILAELTGLDLSELLRVLKVYPFEGEQGGELI